MFLTSVVFLILFIVNQSTAINEQIISSLNKNCTLKYNNEILNEGDSVMIITKLFKVESCQLQRAYHACGPHLWGVINIVCEAIELNRKNSKHHNRLRRFTREKLLIEACCLTTCTINEMARFCP